MADFPLTLSYNYFGAPGCGGSSQLSIGITDRGDLSIVFDLPSEYREFGQDNIVYLGVPGPAVDASRAKIECEFRRTASIPGSRGWRGVIDYLATNEVVAFFTDGDTSGEYPWPGSMEIVGAESVASDLIAAAWSGQPIVNIAQSLAHLPDDVLNTLRARCGSLRSDTVVRPLLRIWNKAYELDVPFGHIVHRAHRFNFEFSSMLRDVRALARVIEAEGVAARKRRAWMISPYAPLISTAIERWRQAHPATSTNTQIGQGMRAGAIRTFLEAYVIQHGRLPDGTHRIQGGQVSPFNVDFDSLRAEDR